MFVLLCGTMALIDTVIGNTIHHFANQYFTLFGSLYGYSSLFANWLWLTVLYLLFCSLSYLAILVIHRIGKTASLLLAVGLGGGVLLVIALFRFVLSDKAVRAVADFWIRAMGFTGDGTTNIFFPVITFLVIGLVFGLGAFALIRRAELKG